MFSLDLNSVCVKDLKQYMLYNLNDVKNLNYINKNDIQENNNNKIIKPNVSKNLIYNNYNKAQSKYSEKKKLFFDDKLFWAFYKIINNYEDTDIQYLNHLKVEKEFKIKLVEKIQNNVDNFKTNIKYYKFRRNYIEDELLNSKNISLYTFECLNMLYKQNIIILKDNNTYTHFSYDINSEEKEEEKEDDDIFANSDFTSYTILKLVYNNSSQKTNNFSIELFEPKYEKENIKTIIERSFFVKDLNKPLKSISAYKSDDLIAIANKLKINIYKEANKKKTKKDLYEEILKLLS
tara:strand:- start:12388 stop:13263 length:876 start_codon:yes stop_codon:yes gene_type:complete